VGEGLGDEVIAIHFDDLPAVEFQGHGGSAAVELIVQALLKFGATQALQHEAFRAISQGRTRAQAAADASRATSLKAANHLLDQANGAFEDELRSIRDLMSLDAARALSQIDKLIELGAIGTRLVEGWRVVLAGRPNVGKSRLLNALGGFERAIVDPTPGTTRDVVSLRTAFQGWPVELSDTAGLRSTDDPIEAAGVAMARARQQGADLVLLVLDQSQPLTDQDDRLIAEHRSAIVVANKCDLPPVWKRESIQVSAERGDGIELLVTEIGRRIVPVAPFSGSGMPFRPVHVRRLRLLEQALTTGRTERAGQILDRWIDNFPQ
jgi:tRNA modification GTPase